MSHSYVIRTYVEAKSDDIGSILLRSYRNEGAI